MKNSNPDDFVPIVYHLNGPQKPFCFERANFYDLEVTPYAWVDGLLNSSAYGGWPGYFNTRKAVATDVTVEVSGMLQDSQLSARAVVCVEPGGVSKDMRIYLMQLLDHYPDNATYYRNAFRQQVNQDVNVLAGDCVQVETTFNLTYIDTDWPEDIVIAAFAQDTLGSGPSEIYNAGFLNAPPVILHYDGFESGDFSGWDEVVQ